MNKIEELADWQTSPIFTRPDGSYVITHGGYPYHVPPETEEFSELWVDVNAYASARPEQVEPEPGPPEPTPEEIKQARISEIKAALDDIDRKSARPLRSVTAGTATDDDRAALADLEARASALRAELAVLTGIQERQKHPE